MLVLSRKAGEKVHIGEDIVVTVLEVQGQRIRLGIDAPADVPVRRAELSFSFATTRLPPFPHGCLPIEEKDE